jgi:uncharacterized membrane protein YeaQ/YmgE (transglycosylase-associated protein family)
LQLIELSIIPVTPTGRHFLLLIKTTVMDASSIIIILILGAVAGWLGGLVFQGGGLGLIGNIVVGIVGGFIGYWLLPRLGLHITTGKAWLNYILTAAVGAVVLLAIINIIFGRNKA